MTTLLLQRLIKSSFNSSPEPHYLSVPKRQNLRFRQYKQDQFCQSPYLRCDDPTQSILPVSPPEEIRQASPPTGSTRPTSRSRMLMQEESQTPTLRQVTLWVQFGERIRKIFLGRLNSLAAKVRKLWNLIYVRGKLSFHIIGCIPDW